MHLEDLASLRQLAYRLFSSALLYPEEGRLNAVAAAAVEMRQQSHSTARFAFFPQWKRLLTALADLKGHRILGEEYMRVFQHSPGGTPCLPYESVYVDPGRQAAGWVMVLLQQEYAAAGLAVSPAMNEPPDHVAVELEFMAFLCGQEAEAWGREAMTDSARALERQAAFLRRHLGLWFPELAQRVATADGQGLYSVVAETAKAFISHDQDLIAVLLDRLRQGQSLAQGAAGEKPAPEAPHAP